MNYLLPHFIFPCSSLNRSAHFRSTLLLRENHVKCYENIKNCKFYTSVAFHGYCSNALFGSSIFSKIMVASCTSSTCFVVYFKLYTRGTQIAEETFPTLQHHRNEFFFKRMKYPECIIFEMMQPRHQFFSKKINTLIEILS